MGRAATRRAKVAAVRTRKHNTITLCTSESGTCLPPGDEMFGCLVKSLSSRAVNRKDRDEMTGLAIVATCTEELGATEMKRNPMATPQQPKRKAKTWPCHMVSPAVMGCEVKARDIHDAVAIASIMA